MFLLHHVDVNQADRLMGRTPLHEAALVGHTDILQLLLEADADPLARDANDDTPYDLAHKGNHFDVSIIATLLTIIYSQINQISELQYVTIVLCYHRLWTSWSKSCLLLFALTIPFENTLP